jgi:hypothetical protein
MVNASIWESDKRSQRIKVMGFDGIGKQLKYRKQDNEKFHESNDDRSGGTSAGANR